MSIIRVSKVEFELDDGTVYPIIPPLTEEMSIEEFKKHYDYATEVVKSRRIVGCDDSNPAELGHVRQVIDSSN